MSPANDNANLKTTLPILASLVAGLLSALPALVNRAESIRCVGNGLVAETATLGQRLAALAYRLGGWGPADAVRLAWGALPWFVGLLILFWGASRLRGLARKLAAGGAWALCIAVSAWSLAGVLFPPRAPINDLRLLAPLSLVEMAKAERGRVFMNPSARSAVAPFGETLVDKSLTEKLCSDLANSPVKWREENRSRPFSSVLISGRVFEAKNLIQHLLEAPDWYLARVDNQGLLFLRGQNPDLTSSPVPDFPTPRERAVYLAQYALNLEIAGFRTLASSSMDEALNIAGKDYEVLFRAASLDASQSLWERARKHSAAAAKASPGAYEANYLLALSLLETRAYEKAFESTSKLWKKYPDDPSILLLHARTARAVHDYSEETKTLEQLLQFATATKSPTAKIHIFLAQSWVQRGFAEQAIAHYQAALAEGLSNEEARDVRAALATIQENRLTH